METVAVNQQLFQMAYSFPSAFQIPVSMGNNILQPCMQHVENGELPSP